jgi:hypothetical protein
MKKPDDLSLTLYLPFVGTLRLLEMLIAAAAFMMPVPAYAYDVDTGHVSLTSFSLELYNKCFPASTAFRDPDAQKRLIQGNRGMDTGKGDMLRHLNLSARERAQLNGTSVFNLTKRIGNWHFYNPDRTDLSRVGLVEQSQKRLWQDLKDGISSNGEKNALLFLGGLMHLVEDVSVPAHAIPVYHGPTEIAALGPEHFKPLVTYMRKAGNAPRGMIKDPIDWISPDSKWLAENLTPAAELCSAVGSGAETPDVIRDGLAHAIYALLQVQIPGCNGVKWGDFWILPAGQEYFGLYAIGNAQPMFGDQGVVRSQNGSICEMRDHDKRYDDVVRELHRAAIKADMKMLRWGEGRIVSGASGINDESGVIKPVKSIRSGTAHLSRRHQ